MIWLGHTASFLALGVKSLIGSELICFRCVCKAWNEWYSEAAAELWVREFAIPRNTPLIFLKLVNQHVQIPNFIAYDHNTSVIPELTSIRSLTVLAPRPFDFSVLPQLTRLDVLPVLSRTLGRAYTWLECHQQDALKASIKENLSRLPNLKSLATYPFDIVGTMTNLEVLHLVHSDQPLTDERHNLERGGDIQGLTNLTRLSIENHFTETSVPSLPLLTRLKLDISSLDENSFDNLPSLTRLNLALKKNFSGIRLSSLTSLTRLTISGTEEVYGHPIPHGVSVLTNLTELKIRSFYNISYNNFSNLTNLRTLCFIGCSLNKEPEFLKLANVTEVELQYCSCEEEDNYVDDWSEFLELLLVFTLEKCKVQI